MSDKQLDALIRAYQRARDELMRSILTPGGGSMKDHTRLILRRVDRVLAAIRRDTGRYAARQIAEVYREAREEAARCYAGRAIRRSIDHGEAIDLLAVEMQTHINQGLVQIGRRVHRYIEDDLLRTLGIQATAEKMAAGTTLARMQRELVRQIQSEGLLSVQYGAGPRAYRVGVDAYAATVARSTTREAGNLARINTVREYGQDLVLLTKHYPTCEVCAPLQGRVYSLSGHDDRFPCLYSLPGFSAGYQNIHPNCRHVVAPTVEGLWKDNERARYLADGKKPITGDIRPSGERELYDQQQAQHRRTRADRCQFERYRAILGDDAPKTFSAFRRIKNADGDRWQNLMRAYRQQNTDI